jgi:hypothetical protein
MAKHGFVRGGNFMMKPFLGKLLALLMVTVMVVGCSSKTDEASLPFAGISLGDSRAQVIEVLGEPSSQVGKETGKSEMTYSVSSSVADTTHDWLTLRFEDDRLVFSRFGSPFDTVAFDFPRTYEGIDFSKEYETDQVQCMESSCNRYTFTDGDDILRIVMYPDNADINTVTQEMKSEE